MKKKINIQLFSTGGGSEEDFEETLFLKLKKPLKTRKYNIDDFNGNMDIIDEGLKDLISFEDSEPINSKTQIWMPSNSSIAPLNLVNIFYPVGSYYETDSSTFDPNRDWGGTWEQDTDGLILVGYKEGDSTFGTIGKIIGEKTHTLTIDEMPSHSHNSSANAFIVDAGTTHDYGYGNAKAPAVNITRASTGNTGSGQEHNNIQPSKVAYRWHRIK